MKTLTALILTIVSLNTFAITEDYILYGHAEVAQKQREIKTQQSEKQRICSIYSKSESVTESCQSSRKTNESLRACLVDAKTALSQSYCLLTKNVSDETIKNCQISTSSEKSELACLILSEKKEISSETKISSCAGLGDLEEINCLKYQH